MRAVKKDGSGEWVIQHEPVSVKGKAESLRLKSNNGDFLYAQTLTLNGYYPKIRLTAGDTQITSQHD